MLSFISDLLPSLSILLTIVQTAAISSKTLHPSNLLSYFVDEPTQIRTVIFWSCGFVRRYIYFDPNVPYHCLCDLWLSGRWEPNTQMFSVLCTRASPKKLNPHCWRIVKMGTSLLLVSYHH